MGPTITRRDLLRLAGGSALGVIFSPLPWKLLDDSAIWTQNWSLNPPLSHAPVSVAYSTCTLCPGGCGVTARCTGGVPFSLAGTRSHPLGRGMLCAAGLAGHQMAMHPLRIVQPCASSGRSVGAVISPIEREKAIAAIGAILNGQPAQNAPHSIALLDRRPGRALSAVYRNFLSSVPGGLYVVSPSSEDATLTALQQMANAPSWNGGWDLQQTRTLLSFGAPVLEAWGTPGQVMDVWSNRARTGFRLIQAETRPSRTARLAQTWLQLRPGTESILALGLGHVIIRENLYAADINKTAVDFAEYARLVAQFDPGRVSALCGVSKESIEVTARTIADGPSLVVAGTDPAGGPLPNEARKAIAGLNVLIGTIGTKGGIVARNPLPGEPLQPPATAIDRIPDQSIRVLIVDGAESGYDMPVSLLRKKVHPQGAIVSLSPLLTPMTAWADFIIPSPAHLEMVEEVSTPPAAVSSSYSLARPLHPVREGATDPLDFLRLLSAVTGGSAAAIPARGAMIRARAVAIHLSERGRVFMPQDGSWVDVKGLATADQFWQKLSDGGCWIDEMQTRNRSVDFSLLPGGKDGAAQYLALLSGSETPGGGSVTVMPYGIRGATASAQVSPLLSKIFQESDLKDLDGTALLHPDTAASFGLSDGDSANLHNGAGTMRVVVRCDGAVLRGVVHVATGPRRNNSDASGCVGMEGTLSLCEPGCDGTWRVTTATIGKAHGTEI